MPFQAGGGTDAVARAFAKASQKHFPKGVVVLNKAGGRPSSRSATTSGSAWPNQASIVSSVGAAKARRDSIGVASAAAPVASNDDEAGRSKNRRVELVKR